MSVGSRGKDLGVTVIKWVVKAKAVGSLAVKDQRAKKTKVEIAFMRSPIILYLLKYLNSA